MFLLMSVILFTEGLASQVTSHITGYMTNIQGGLPPGRFYLEEGLHPWGVFSYREGWADPPLPARKVGDTHPTGTFSCIKNDYLQLKLKFLLC